ncbi:hypothetical protein DL96DRAFT_88668 [Flagelloscypha sp. PMI_526]|nr:hypothetical protein DL96DRAFT_88668 [Flagelloscypha sp. PMI_526]
MRLQPAPGSHPEGVVSAQLASARSSMRPSTLSIPARPARTSQDRGDALSMENLISFSEPGSVASSLSSSLRQSSVKHTHRANPYPLRSNPLVAEPSGASLSHGDVSSNRSQSQQRKRRSVEQPTAPRQVEFRFTEYNPHLSGSTSAESSQGRQHSTSLSPPAMAQSPAGTYSPPMAMSPTSPVASGSGTPVSIPVHTPHRSAVPLSIASSTPVSQLLPQMHPQTQPHHHYQPQGQQSYSLQALPQEHFQLPESPLKRYLITMDAMYDPINKMLTVTLELPGVREVSVTLCTNVYNCVRMIKVTGRSYSTLPANLPHLPPGAANQMQYMHAPFVTANERRCGLFTREFPVHPLLTASNVSAVLDSGLLVLQMTGGAPAMSADISEIPVRFEGSRQ